MNKKKKKKKKAHNDNLEYVAFECFFNQLMEK